MLVVTGEVPAALDADDHPGREALTLDTKFQLAKNTRDNAQDAMRYGPGPLGAVKRP